jgi:hypothetical protein
MFSFLLPAHTPHFYLVGRRDFKGVRNHLTTNQPLLFTKIITISIAIQFI